MRKAHLIARLIVVWCFSDLPYGLDAVGFANTSGLIETKGVQAAHIDLVGAARAVRQTESLSALASIIMADRPGRLVSRTAHV